MSTTKTFLALGDAHLVDDSNAKASIDKSHAQLTGFKILCNVFQEDQTLPFWVNKSSTIELRLPTI